MGCLAGCARIVLLGAYVRPPVVELSSAVSSRSTSVYLRPYQHEHELAHLRRFSTSGAPDACTHAQVCDMHFIEAYMISEAGMHIACTDNISPFASIQY